MAGKLARSSAARGFLAASLGLGLAACSVLNPHVTPSMDRPAMSPLADGQGGSVAPVMAFFGNLPHAIDYANSLRQEYYDAVGEQSLLRNGMALTLVPISAAALFLGINSTSDAPRAAIAGLGIGGASLFALGEFFHSKPRQAIYLAGSEALGCAILASRPYLIPDDAMTAFKTALTEVYPAMDKAALKLAEFSALAKKAEEMALAEEALHQIKRAAAIAARGESVNDQIEKAGLTLLTATDTIRDQVSAQIVKDEPDFDSILILVGGLGATAKVIGPPPVEPPAKPPQGAGTPEARSSADPAALLAALEELSRKVAPIARMVNRVEAAQSVVGDIAACQPAAVGAALKVEPGTEVQFRKGEKGSKGLIVSGGNAPYIAELLDTPPSGTLVVSQPAPFGPRVNVEIKEAVPDNTYHARVADSAGRSLLIMIKVGSGQPAVQPGRDDSNAAPVTPAPGLATDLVKAAQQKLFCAEPTDPRVDGVVGEQTELALAIYREAAGTGARGPATDTELVHITEQVRDCPPEAANQYEALVVADPALLRTVMTALREQGATSFSADSKLAPGTTVRQAVVAQATDLLVHCPTPPIDKRRLALGVSKSVQQFVARGFQLASSDLPAAEKQAQACAPLGT
jgi:hypothetical protein